MKIKKLYLKNIRSYREEDITFPDGTILLAGDVGAGKTSLLLAIEYALFGLQPGQKGSALLRTDAFQGEVSLELAISGRTILIERKLKRNNKNVTNEYSSITIDGEKFEASLTEIKTKILEFLGYPQEFVRKNNLLYRYTVYTPQEQMKQIILEDPEVRLNILRHILGLEKYKRIRENLVSILNYLKEESKILQGEIKNLDQEKSKVEIRKLFLKELDKEIIEKKKVFDIKLNERKKREIEYTQLEEKIKEKEYLEREVEKTKIMLVNKYDNLSTINLEISEIERTIAEAGELFNEKEYQEIIKKITEKNKKIEELTNNYGSLLSQINSLEKNKQETLERRNRIFRIDFCPTCLQDVPETHKHNILNETENTISNCQRGIVLIEKKIIEVTLSLEKEKKDRNALEENKSLKEALRAKSEYLEKTKKRKHSLSKQAEALEKDIELLGKHIQALKEKALEFSKFDNLAKLKKDELNRNLQEERQAEISLAEVNKELELTKKEIMSLEASISEKEEAKNKLANLLELHDWLSSTFLSLIEFTERNVLIKIRQEFSKVFKKWFRMLVPQESLTVRLDESFSPIILFNDFEMEYSFLSGGERTASALAYRLALNQTINSILSEIKTKEIVILDEPTDGFSDQQLDRIREVLQELNVSQLIIVSHEQKIESFVNTIIKVKKTEDVSYIESTPLSREIFQHKA